MKNSNESKTDDSNNNNVIIIIIVFILIKRMLEYHNTDIVAVKPTVACHVRDTNVMVGDKVEIVCKVSPNGNEISSLEYENVMKDGTKRLIKFNTPSDVFKYHEVRGRNSKFL